MKILEEVQTKYHNLKIVQEVSTRKLLSGNGMCREQSGIDIDNLRYHVFDYSLLAMYSLTFIPSPQKILIIGLGGGVIPREMSFFIPEAQIDVIEIDEKIVDVAKEYFYFKESDKVKVHIGDAFIIVKEMIQNKKYDLIIIDAFLNNYIPFPLMSVEFMKDIKTILKNESVLLVNLANCHPSYNSHVNTINSVFKNDIFELMGHRNNLSCMLYIPMGNLLPSNVLWLPIDYYPTRIPKKKEITPIIRASKIFSLEYL